jgi:hypothetical protein
MVMMMVMMMMMMMMMMIGHLQNSDVILSANIVRLMQRSCPIT